MSVGQKFKVLLVIAGFGFGFATVLLADIPAFSEETNIHGGRGAIGTVQYLPSKKGNLVLAVRLDDARYTLLNPRSSKVFRRSAQRLAAVGDLERDGEPDLLVWSYLGGETGNLVREDLNGNRLWAADVRIPPVHNRQTYIPLVLIYDLDENGTAEIIVPRESGQVGVFGAVDGKLLRDTVLTEQAAAVINQYLLVDNPYLLKSITRIRGDRTYFDFVGDDQPEWTPQPLDGRAVVPFVINSFDGNLLWQFIPPPPRGIHNTFPEAVFSVDVVDTDGDELNEIFLGGYNRVFILMVDGRILKVLDNVFF